MEARQGLRHRCGGPSRGERIVITNQYRRIAFWMIACVLFAAGVVAEALIGGRSAQAWQPRDTEVQAGTTALRLDSPSLIESSGLAFSHRNSQCIWSHNDSGDSAQLLAFGVDGKPSGRTVLRGVRASDWEDMASFVDGGPRLLVADVGDNDAQRSSVSLYVFDEPSPVRNTRVHRFQHVVVRYPDGPQNCESVAVDVARRRILLLGKSALVATMFEVPLPPREPGSVSGEAGEKKAPLEHTATAIAQVAIPLATGMDLCPVTGDLWVSGYLHAYRYPQSKNLSLQERLRQLPQMVELPKLKQVEAIAVDDEGVIWVTSEGSPAMMQRVGYSPR